MDKPDVDSIEGLSPAISIDQKTTSRNPRSTVGTVTEIYDYLRLLWARIGHPHCHSCGAPIAGQSVEQIVDHVMTLDEGTRFMVLAPVVRGPQGRVQGPARGAALRGLHARQDRRRAAPARGRDRARQEVQARHRGGRGPPADEAGRAQAAGRLGRDRGRAGGGHRRGGAGGRRQARGPRTRSRIATGAKGVRESAGHARLLREVLVPEVRHLDAGAGAADLLLQLAARRMPALHRPRLTDGDRPRPGGRPEPHDQRGRDPAVELGRRLLRAAGAGDRREVRDRPRRAVGGHVRGGPGPVPLRRGGRARLRLLPQPDGPPALVHGAAGGRRHEPRAPLSRDRLRVLARAHRGVHVGAAVPRVPRRAPAAGDPRRARSAGSASTSSRASRRARRSSGSTR